MKINKFRLSYYIKLNGLLPLIGALAVSLCLRLINLVWPVRSVTLSRKGRLSQYILYLDPILRVVNETKFRRPIVVVVSPVDEPNRFLADLYKSKIKIFFGNNSRIGQWLTLFPEIGKLDGKKRKGAWRLAPVLSFDEKSEAKGQELLRGMGVPQGSKFVCFGVRDESYYESILACSPQSRLINREAHDNTWIRNPNLANYMPMAEFLAAEGYYVFRMGSVVKDSLPVDRNPRIIDYANLCRSEFGDIFLLGTCEFVVSGGAGFWWIANAFNRPIVLTDSYSYSSSPYFNKRVIYIPQKFFMKEEERFLSFSEVIASKGKYSYLNGCLEDGVDLVRNSADEIMEAVIEMCRRIDGSWIDDELGLKLQREWGEIASPGESEYQDYGRIGQNFIKNNQQLIRS